MIAIHAFINEKGKAIDFISTDSQCVSHLHTKQHDSPKFDTLFRLTHWLFLI